MSVALQGKPLVSIGLFVYNGDKHIRQALDSLLTQDYPNFELVISDNASTDGTRDICLEYAERDKRVHYHRSEVNMGAVRNAEKVFELSSGEYFMWAAHDDYWDPAYIRLCIETFEQNENAVLVTARHEFINADTGDVILTNNGITTTRLNAFQRFRAIASQRSYLGDLFYGVHKSNVVRKVLPFRKIFPTDVLFLAGISLHGDFITRPEILTRARGGGASSNNKRYTGSKELHSNAFFRRYPYFGWLVAANGIAFQSDKFKLYEKFGLALLLTGDYMYFGIVRMAAWLHLRLQKVWPGAASYTREMWHRAEESRRRPGGAGLKYSSHGSESGVEIGKGGGKGTSK